MRSIRPATAGHPPGYPRHGDDRTSPSPPAAGRGRRTLRSTQCAPTAALCPAIATSTLVEVFQAPLKPAPPGAPLQQTHGRTTHRGAHGAPGGAALRREGQRPRRWGISSSRHPAGPYAAPTTHPGPLPCPAMIVGTSTCHTTESPTISMEAL